MSTNHDDLPHPVPSYAFLRYKENWFFVIIAPEQNVFGVVHANTEAGFNRARFSASLNVDGRLYKYGNEIPFPAEFAMARQIGDENLRIGFIEAGAKFTVDIEAPEFSAALTFSGRFPTFDFSACKYANPERPSGQEVLTLGTNLPYVHQQQSLTVTGRLDLKPEGGERRTVEIRGAAYRDHSWGFRAETIIAKHTWSALHFQDRIIGVKTSALLSRLGTVSCEGYVADANGSRALTDIDIVQRGDGPDGLGATVRYALRDVYGETFTIVADVAGRFGYVPLISEKPGGTHYQVVENFCPTVLEQTGEKGVSLTELGRNSAFQGSVTQN